MFKCLTFFFLLIFLAVPPTVKAVNQLVGAPVESHVTLQCIVEAYPKPLNGWYKNEGRLNFFIYFFFVTIIEVYINICRKKKLSVKCN